MYKDFYIDTNSETIEIVGFKNKLSVVSKVEIENPTQDMRIIFRAKISDVMENIIKFGDDEKTIAKDWISDEVIKEEYERRFK